MKEAGKNNSERDERLDKIEEKVLRLEKENKKLKKHIKKEREKPENKDSKKISRREFLKKAGIGAIGLGALSLSPASALNIKDADLDIYTGTSKNDLQKYFSVNQGGPVSIQNTNLDLNSNSLMNVNEINGTEVSSLGGSSIQSSSDVNHNSTQGGTDSDAHHRRYTDSEARSAVNVDGVTQIATGTASLDSGGGYIEYAYNFSQGGSLVLLRDPTVSTGTFVLLSGHTDEVFVTMRSTTDGEFEYTVYKV